LNDCFAGCRGGGYGGGGGGGTGLAAEADRVRALEDYESLAMREERRRVQGRVQGRGRCWRLSLFGV
jgi:hypothetical protein